MRKARDIKSRFGRPETPAVGERRAGRRLYAPLLITVVLGLAVTGLGFFLVREWEAQEARGQFEKLADERREILQRRINANLEVLYSLANFFRGSQKVERAEFRTFVEEVFQRHPDLFSLQWRPRVLAREREAFERGVRAEGFPGFHIKDAAPPDGFVPAPKRPEYFPILYSEPEAKDLLVLGGDLFPQTQFVWARLLGMQRAAWSATAVATGGIKLYQIEHDPRDPYTIVVYLPVYCHARVPADKRARLRDLRGFVGAILRVGQMLEGSVQGSRPAGVDIVVLDETPGAEVVQLYHHRSRLSPAANSDSWKQLAGMRAKATVEIADRRLSLLYLATPAYRLTQLRWAAWSVPIALLLMFAVTSGFLGSSLRRTQRSQRMARALAQEIESREHSERSLRESEARLERQTAALMALTSDRVIRFLDLRRAMQELTERAALALDVARVSVWRFSDDQSKLECLEIYESSQDRHSVGGELNVAEYPAYFQALRGCWTLAADDARSDPRTREFASHYLVPLGVTSMLDAPVRRGVQLVGIVCHEHIGPARRWTLDEQNFAGSVADLAALALEIAQHEQARRMLEEAREDLEGRVAERTRELQEANERLKELDRLKSEFLATMSHELRTPLNSIIGFTGILKQGIAGELNAEQHKQISMVYGSAKHLLTLINDLLDLSRIESGRMEIQREPFRCEEVIAEVIASLAPAVAEKALKLVSDIPAPLPEVRSDRKRVFQILLNLANNGVKFTEVGEVRIRCVARGEALEFRVTDTGIGIKPENMALLFEAFRQVDGSARRRYEGAGLGVHLSRRLAGLLGGDIRAESEYGKGSRFTLTLPLGAG